ncbi:MAG: hypothetical protein P8X68_03660 [Desulfobacterales bacterium]|jgi:hypothetical protein
MGVFGAYSSFILAGCGSVGGSGSGAGGEGAVPLGEGSIIYDPSSNHLANYVASDGSILDFWAQTDGMAA